MCVISSSDPDKEGRQWCRLHPTQFFFTKMSLRANGEGPGAYFHAGDRMGQLAWDWSCGYKSIHVPHGSTAATSNIFILRELKVLKDLEEE